MANKKEISVAIGLTLRRTPALSVNSCAAPTHTEALQEYVLRPKAVEEVEAGLPFRVVVCTTIWVLCARYRW